MGASFPLCGATHWLLTPLRIKAPVLPSTKEALHELAPGSFSHLISHHSFPTILASFLFLPQGLCTCCSLCPENSPSPVWLPATHSILWSNVISAERIPVAPRLKISTSLQLSISLPCLKSLHTTNHISYILLCSSVPCLSSPPECELRRTEFSVAGLPYCLSIYDSARRTVATQYIFIDWICCNQFLYVNLAIALNPLFDFLTIQRNLSNYKPPWDSSRVSSDAGVGGWECYRPHLFQIKLKHS